jgi:hypothetical protein
VDFAGLCNDATAPIYMATPNQMLAPDRILRQGKYQFEIAQVAELMEEAVRITIGGCCIWSRTNSGKDGRGQIGQNHIRIINDIDGG